MIIFGLSVNNFSYGQLNYLPLEHFYKDRVFGVTLENDSAVYRNRSQNFGAFFPAFEHQTYKLNQLNRPLNRKTWIGRKLFDDHLGEYNNGHVFLNFDLLGDLSLGRDFKDPENKQYFFNTRGVQVSGGIGKYFGFFSSLRETQARFLDYQVYELRKGGILQVNPSGEYSQGSAFVSGGNRTKPFGDGAFDFAHVNGGFMFSPKKDLIFSFGNNPLFIGAGHRSLFYSDHSSMFPHLRMSWKINQFFNTELIYGQHLNLIRMELNTPGTEKLFEKKGFTLRYINFNPLPSLQISFFEGTSWLKSDNNNVGRVHGLYYSPLPFINPVILGQQGSRSNTILGAQTIWNPIRFLHIYSQLAFTHFVQKKPAVQFGFRLSEPFQIRNLHLLFEVNSIPKDAYQHENPRLNYVNNNMSLAHPMGAGLDEILGRINYEWKRIGIMLQSNLIQTVQNAQNETNAIALTPRASSGEEIFNNVLIGYAQIDLCYRFNKKSNGQLFISAVYRKQKASDVNQETLYLGFGMRTQLINRYFDL